MGVGQHDASAGDRRQHARNAAAAGRAELDRIGLVVVDSAVDDVDRIEPAERSQPQPTLTNDDVGALDRV